MELHLLLHLLVEGGPVGAGGGRRCRGAGIPPSVGVAGRVGVVCARAAGTALPGGAAPAGLCRGGRPTAGGRPGASSAGFVSSSSSAAPMTLALVCSLFSWRVCLVHGIREEGRTVRRLGSLHRMLSMSTSITASIIASVIARSVIVVAMQLLLLATLLLLLLLHVMVDDVARDAGPSFGLLTRLGLRPRPRRRPQGLLLGQPPPGTHPQLFF